MSVTKPFSNKIEIEFSKEIDLAVVKDIILQLTARGIRMVRCRQMSSCELVHQGHYTIPIPVQSGVL